MEDTLLDFITNEFVQEGQASPKINDNLLESGIVDSLGMMKLIRFIEQRFDRKIPFEDMVVENFSTVENMVRYLSKE